MNVVSEAKPATAVASTPAALPRRGLARRLRVPLLALSGLLLVLCANWYVSVYRWLQSTDNAYVQGDIAVLGPRVEGYVAAIRVTDNQRVTAGQVLIELDQALLKAAEAQAQATLAEADAALATLTQQVTQQQAQITAAAAQINQAQAERTRAQADAQRYRSLSGSGWASRQIAERSVADMQKAEAQLAVATAQHLAAQEQLQVLQAQSRQAEARRAQAAAAVERARIDLDNTTLRAPFDGIVGNRTAQLGAYVRPGQQLVAVAPPPERQWVTANFKETQLARFKAGQPVRITVDAIPGLEIRARVESLAPATGALFSLLPPENATGNFTKVVQRVPVRLALAADEAAKMALLRPGLSVVAEVDTREDPNAPRGLFGAAAATLGLR